MDETVSFLGVCRDEPVLKYTATTKMGSNRIQMGDRFYGPYKKILFATLTPHVLYLIAEDNGSVGTDVISSEYPTYQATPTEIAEALKHCRVTHCGIHRGPTGAIGFHFVAHEEEGQSLYWQTGITGEIRRPEKETIPSKKIVKALFGVCGDDVGNPVFCWEDGNGYHIFYNNGLRQRLGGFPLNGKFRVIGGKPVYWYKEKGGFTLREADASILTSNFPDVDLCKAGDTFFFSHRSSAERMDVRQGHDPTPVCEHRSVEFLGFAHDRYFCSATDDGKNWYVRWGDYKGPLYDEIYSISETENGIEYVARKRRRLYRVRASC